MDMTVCDECNEEPAVVRFTATSMRGVVLDVQELCLDCADHTQVGGVHTGSVHTCSVRFSVPATIGNE